MKEPVFVRATALMQFLPNLAPRTVLQAVVEQLRGLMFLLVLFAHLATCVAEQVWMMAPLLIQLAKEFNVDGVGRPCFAGPLVWFINVRNELILQPKVLLH
ncbi:hypothetical protein JYU10_00165 [bacterium AH-315-J04]|nr:hypothetical protein [bacterium AH-315-J04]